MKRQLLFYSFIWVGLINAQAQSGASRTNAETIDKFVSSVVSEISEIPGLAISVTQGEKVVLSKGYGFYDMDQRKKATSLSVYYIASATKQFVGLLAAQLHIEEVLKIDEPITQYAPIKNFKDKSRFENITISDLLAHTSGIYNRFLGFQLALGGEYKQSDLIRILEQETHSLGNRKSFRYDNLGYNIFEIILKEETGNTWKQHVQERYFKPMKMQRSSSSILTAEKNAWEIALPYLSTNSERKPKQITTQKNDETLHAAGGLLMSADDASKWLIMNMNKGFFEGKQIIDPKAFDLAHSILVSNIGRGIFRYLGSDTGYGMGIINAKYGDFNALYHNGDFDGYNAHFSFLPAEKIGISIFANEDRVGDDVSQLIVHFIYDLMLEHIDNVEEYIKEEVNKLKTRLNRIQLSISQNIKEKRQRNWNLTHDITSYQGEFYNENRANMNITLDKGIPQFTMGIMKAKGIPNVEKDTFSVEFQVGKEEDVLFVFNKKKVIAVVYNGDVFYRR